MLIFIQIKFRLWCNWTLSYFNTFRGQRVLSEWALDILIFTNILRFTLTKKLNEDKYDRRTEFCEIITVIFNEHYFLDIDLQLIPDG